MKCRNNFGFKFKVSSNNNKTFKITVSPSPDRSGILLWPRLFNEAIKDIADSGISS